jgi:GAF domain-containing protein
MNVSSVNQTLQFVAWFIALLELVFGLYILSLNAWHTANRHVSAVLLLIAANVFATGWLLSATNAAQATWPIYIHATTTPAMQVGLLLITVVLLKPDWLRGRRRWLWWPLYGLWPLSFLLTLVDVRWGTRLWYTGLDASYTGGYVSMSSYATGLLAMPFRILTNYAIPVVIFLLTLYIAVLNKRTMPSTRLLARYLLGAQIAGMAVQFGLRGLRVSEGPLLATLLSGTIYAVAYAYAAFRQMISERRLQRGRLQIRLTSLVLVVAIPIVVAVVVFASTRAGTLLEQDAAARLRESNYALATHASTWLDFNARALRELVSLPDIVSMNAGRQKPILQAMAAAYPDMYLVSTTDLNGINVARNDDVEPKDYSDRQWFRAARDGAPLTFQALVGRTTGTPALVVSMPIRDASGTIVGVGMFASELTSIARAVQAGAVGETGFAYVVDAQNQALAHPDPAFSAELRDLSAYPPVAALRQGDRGPVTFEADGQRWRAYVDQLDNGWGVVVQQPEAELLGSLRPFQRVSWIALAVGAMTLSGLTWLSVRQILQPIGALTDTVTAIAAGDLTRTAPVESQDEVGDLAHAFNRMTEQLRELIGGLEQRVSERTAELERRSAYLEASAEVGRAATSILDADKLIWQAVELIRERFDLYYVGLFLVDAAGEYAVLQAGTGEAGRTMLARGHQIRVGEGMIGWSVANAQARIALDVGEDARRLATPELPETRSEAALPLRSRGRVLGALTVQSAQPAAFDEAATAVLQTMADQVAVALDNARLFAEIQAALESARRAYSELSREAWAKLFQARPDVTYRSDEHGVTVAQDLWRPEEKQALEEGRTVQGDGADARAESPLAVPIKVRGNVIGVIDAHKPGGAGKWTAEEAALMETLSEQLGIALESARLYQDSQRRATSEQLTGEVTARMRESLDMDRMLQTAVREIGEALGIAEVEVRLGSK